jgi:hypothetical protein
VDVLTTVANLDFDRAWENRTKGTYGGVEVWMLGLRELIESKRAAGRDQDRMDLKQLTEVLPKVSFSNTERGKDPV